jgi:hypothetical protein
VTGQIPVLECLFSGTRGHLGLCLVLSSIKWSHYSRILALGSLAQCWQPPGTAPGGRMCVEPGLEEELDRANV